MCVSATDKPPIMEHEAGDEDAAMYCTDDILVAFPELTAPHAETEDLSVGEDEEWWTSLSPARRDELVTRFDLSATTVHLLTPTCSDDGCDELSSNSWPADDECTDSADSYRVSSDPSTDGASASEYAAANSSLQYTFYCIDGAGHLDVSQHVMDAEDEDYVSATSDGVAEDVQTTNSTDRVSSVDAKPRNSRDYCPHEDDKLNCQQMSVERNVKDYISTLVHEVAKNLQNRSSSAVSQLVGFEHNGDEDNNKYDESVDDNHRSVGSLRAAEAGSDSRYVSSLFVMLVDEPSCSQAPFCCSIDQSLVVDVSNNIHQWQVCHQLFCMTCPACRRI